MLRLTFQIPAIKKYPRGVYATCFSDNIEIARNEIAKWYGVKSEDCNLIDKSKQDFVMFANSKI